MKQLRTPPPRSRTCTWTLPAVPPTPGRPCGFTPGPFYSRAAHAMAPPDLNAVPNLSCHQEWPEATGGRDFLPDPPISPDREAGTDSAFLHPYKTQRDETPQTGSGGLVDAGSGGSGLEAWELGGCQPAGGWLWALAPCTPSVQQRVTAGPDTCHHPHPQCLRGLPSCLARGRRKRGSVWLASRRTGRRGAAPLHPPVLPGRPLD